MTAAGVALPWPELTPRAARAQSAVGAVDRVGLLLPKSAGPFARASAAVRAGIEAGYRRDGGGLAVDIYESRRRHAALAAAYRGMLERGTALALGPLTRRRRHRAAGARRHSDHHDRAQPGRGRVALPWNVIVFTLAIESEAQQIAAAAMQDLRAQGAGGSLRARSS